jgi:hypothetical protein
MIVTAAVRGEVGAELEAMPRLAWGGRTGKSGRLVS